MAVYRKQVVAFRRKFGREMGPEDPYFFDPNTTTPQLRASKDSRFAMDVLVEMMVETGIDPAAIYAFKSTGGLFPDPTVPFSPAQQSEWNAAIREYHDKLRGLRKQ
jgi:hypothetical protein